MQKNYTMLFSAAQAKKSMRLPGVPVTNNNLRKCARAKHLLDSGHIELAMRDEGWRIYQVTSQSGDNDLYKVTLNGSEYSCNCPNSEKSAICKHRIACLMHEYKNSYDARITEGERGKFNKWIDECKADTREPQLEGIDE